MSVLRPLWPPSEKFVHRGFSARPPRVMVVVEEHDTTFDDVREEDREARLVCISQDLIRQTYERRAG